MPSGLAFPDARIEISKAVATSGDAPLKGLLQPSDRSILFGIGKRTCESRSSLLMKRRIELLILLCAGFALGPRSDLASLAAEDAGSCLYRCESSTCYDFSNTTVMCQELRAKCQAQCSRPAKNSFGSIAISRKDKTTGWSYGYDTKDQAEKAAVANCTKAGGSGCEVYIYFNNECGAVATDGGKIITWGTDAAKQSAIQGALRECSKGGGKNCVIKASQCSN
jgi:hypothetical protein